VIDPKLLRNEPEEVARNLARRGFHLDVEALKALEGKRKHWDVEVDRLRAERNANAKAVGMAKGRGEEAGDNPWDAQTLEWFTTSPPPHHNFYRLPQIRSERPTWDYNHPEHRSLGHGVDPVHHHDVVHAAAVGGDPAPDPESA